MFARAENFISTMSQGVTLGWLGSSVAVYADDDPVWAGTGQDSAAKSWRESFPDYIGRLPIAVRAEVSERLALDRLPGRRAGLHRADRAGHGRIGSR